MAVDWSSWPLLEVRTELRTAVSEALAEAIDRGEAFVAVVETPGRQARGDGALEQVRMVRGLRPGMARHCRGLAMVLPPDAMGDSAKLIKAGPTIWGCPVNVVDDLASARAWAVGQLGGH